MDEPFTGLDPVNVMLLREAFLELRDRGRDGRLLHPPDGGGGGAVRVGGDRRPRPDGGRRPAPRRAAVDGPADGPDLGRGRPPAAVAGRGPGRAGDPGGRGALDRRARRRASSRRTSWRRRSRRRAGPPLRDRRPVARAGLHRPSSATRGRGDPLAPAVPWHADPGPGAPPAVAGHETRARRARTWHDGAARRRPRPRVGGGGAQCGTRCPARVRGAGQVAGVRVLDGAARGSRDDGRPHPTGGARGGPGDGHAGRRGIGGQVARPIAPSGVMDGFLNAQTRRDPGAATSDVHVRAGDTIGVPRTRCARGRRRRGDHRAHGRRRAGLPGRARAGRLARIGPAAPDRRVRRRASSTGPRPSRRRPGRS